jgi:hypothetical protein
VGGGVVNKLYCDKKDNSVSSYPECLKSELSFLAKMDFGSESKILFHASGKNGHKTIPSMRFLRIDEVFLQIFYSERDQVKKIISFIS